MERYTLQELYTLSELYSAIHDAFEDGVYASGVFTMGLTLEQIEPLIEFLSMGIFGYFFDDLVAYADEDKPHVRTTFENRLVYDIAVKLPYWYKKYNYIQKLLTTDDLSLLQTSKMTSSSSDTQRSASGTLQKTATTPTGVSATGSTDSFDVEISETSGTMTGEVETTGFADKYTNAQQKFANAGKVEGERSGEVLREGSIDELLNVLEKLPSSFADEITKAVQKHFIFDYEGEERGIYDETN